MSDKATDLDNALRVLGGEQFKTALLVLPVLGTLAAVTYDVGYFTGVDINYFTVFSLSEHVVFALQALPETLLVLLLALIIALGKKKYETTSDEPTQRRRRVGSAFIVIIGVLLFALGSYAGIPLIMGFGILIIVLGVVVWNDFSRAVFLCYLAFALFGGIFCLGWDAAYRYVKSDVPTHVLNGDTAGRLIMAGERGVLFVTSSNRQIILFKWDGIDSIKSIKLSRDDELKMYFETFRRHQ
jgi:hypothetical protein